MQTNSHDSIFAPVRCALEQRDEGGFVLSSEYLLEPVTDTLIDVLERQAARYPERPFLVEQDAGVWQPLTYAGALARAKSVAQWLLDRGASPRRPVLILAENSVAHATMALGAMMAGIPVSQVSPNYSRSISDFGRLRHVVAVLRPAIVMFDEASAHARAISNVDWGGAALVAVTADHKDVLPFAEALQETPAASADAARRTIGPDSIAKILFTSGSTGTPKGVVNTHRMMISNQRALAMLWPFLRETAPVLVDWLPWNHTFGSNQNFNLTLENAGTLYIDRGKPLKGAFDRTLQALQSVSPTVYFNVPRGYDLLAAALERDGELRESFFRRLRLMGYAGAAMPQPIWDKLGEMASATIGRPVPVAALWGSTETAPISTLVHFDNRHPGNLGVPIPGTSVKFLPANGRLEMRVRGPNVTPGYWTPNGIEQSPVDDEGFYKIGDAGLLVEPGEPSKGILFDGRVAENFKLSSGTWVNAGGLRVRAVSALSSLVSDAVVTGHDREYLGLMLFPKFDGLRALGGDLSGLSDEELLQHAAARQAIAAGLTTMNGDGGSSMRVRRALLLAEPPSVEAGEITDKGYLNQRAILTRRAADVLRLYSVSPDPQIIEVA